MRGKEEKKAGEEEKMEEIETGDSVTNNRSREILHRPGLGVAIRPIKAMTGPRRCPAVFMKRAISRVHSILSYNFPHRDK